MPPVAPTQEIEQVSEVGQATVTARAQLMQEYVPAAAQRWYSTKYIQSLPNPTDRFMRDFGARLYEEDMPLDAQIYSTLSILVMAVLAEGVQLQLPEGADEMDEADRVEAERYHRFCQSNLDNLAHPLNEVLFEGIEGMLKIGHKPLEQVYEPRTFDGEQGPMIALCDLKPKPYNATAFAVDVFNNTVGLVKTAMSGWASLTYISEQNADQLIPRQKFAIPTWRPKNGDPRGTSHLQSVYTPWWVKQGITPELLAYIARFGQPSVHHELPPDAQDIDVLDTVTGLPTGEKQSIVEAATEALLAYQSGGVFVYDNGGRVGMLEAKGNGEVFLRAYDHEDRQIAKGILMQTLTTEEGKHMARAASQTHQDILGIFIRFVRSVVEAMLEQDVIRWLIIYNYGEEAVRLMPRVSLGITEQQDWPDEARAVAVLKQVGYLDDDQLPALDRRLGLDPRSVDVEGAALVEEPEIGSEIVEGE